jgi:hypothetical protein
MKNDPSDLFDPTPFFPAPSPMAARPLSSQQWGADRDRADEEEEEEEERGKGEKNSDEEGAARHRRRRRRQDQQGDRPRKKLRRVREVLIPLPSMRPDTVRVSYWKALYELWRLSWYQIPHDHSVAPTIDTCGEASAFGVLKNAAPQPVFMWDWLRAIDHGDLLMKSIEFQCKFGANFMEAAQQRERGATIFTGNSSSSPRTPSERDMREEWFRRAHTDLEHGRMSAEELAQVAGALLKTGLAGTRTRNHFVFERSEFFHPEAPADVTSPPPISSSSPSSSSSLPQRTEGAGEQERAATNLTVMVYYIDPSAAVLIQRFINESPIMACDDTVRPGYEGCVDQLAAIEALRHRMPAPQITQFSNLLVRRHMAWAKSAQSHTRALTTHIIESARNNYPL